MKTVKDFIFLDSKIIADGDSSHELKDASCLEVMSSCRVYEEGKELGYIKLTLFLISQKLLFSIHLITVIFE